MTDRVPLSEAVGRVLSAGLRPRERGASCRVRLHPAGWRQHEGSSVGRLSPEAYLAPAVVCMMASGISLMETRTLGAGVSRHGAASRLASDAWNWTCVHFHLWVIPLLCGWIGLYSYFFLTQPGGVVLVLPERPSWCLGVASLEVFCFIFSLHWILFFSSCFSLSFCEGSREVTKATVASSFTSFSLLFQSSHLWQFANSYN